MPLPSGSASRDERDGLSESSSASTVLGRWTSHKPWEEKGEGVWVGTQYVQRRGTPGKMCTFPLTTAMGTQRSSLGKRNCFSSGIESSVGNSTIRSFAVFAGESSSQLNAGWDGCGLDSFFMRS